MKFLSILAAASLALAPAIATAGSAEQGNEDSRPIAGPTAAQPLDDDELPAAAIAAAGVVILGAGIFALMGSGDDSISSTNNQAQ